MKSIHRVDQNKVVHEKYFFAGINLKMFLYFLKTFKKIFLKIWIEFQKN